MHPYVFLVGIAGLLNALCAGMIASRYRDRRESRITAALHFGAAWWAFCEVAWNVAPDPATSHAWMRASAPGWVFIGPLVMHSFIVLEGGPTRLRSLVPFAYLAGTVFLLIGVSGPILLEEAVRTSWGFGYRVGPAYPYFYVATIAFVASGYTLLFKLMASATTEADRRQRPFVLTGMIVPLIVASTTDVMLPMADVQVPRLGTASFAVLGLLTVANVLRFGYSLVVPSSFSQEILATLSDGVAVLHPNGRVRSVNDGLVRLSGLSRAQLERMDIRDLLTPDLEAMGHEVHEEEGVLRGASRRPVAITSRPVRDRQGNALGVVVSLHDLREIEALRSRLVKSDRLAAVGQLAAGIAHEINNPLAFVRANLSHLESQWKRLRAPLRAGDEIPRDDLCELVLETDEIIEESLEGVDRAAEVIRGIRGFSHAGTGEREPSDLNDLLEQALVMAGPRLRGRVSVERRLSELPPLRCAVQQMKQVFLNLILNAEQALGEGGTLRLATRAGADHLEVEVEDDGPGIPEEIRDRIFDPFFTTKAVGEGTGLGLGICHEIVRSHGGSIEVDSAPGEGARFRVRLPLDR